LVARKHRHPPKCVAVVHNDTMRHDTIQYETMQYVRFAQRVVNVACCRIRGECATGAGCSSSSASRRCRHRRRDAVLVWVAEAVLVRRTLGNRGRRVRAAWKQQHRKHEDERSACIVKSDGTTLEDTRRASIRARACGGAISSTGAASLEGSQHDCTQRKRPQGRVTTTMYQSCVSTPDPACSARHVRRAL
jgi:hypothetical protein